MDIAVVEKLIKLMNGTTVSSIEIEEKDMKIKVENMQPTFVPNSQVAVAPQIIAPQIVPQTQEIQAVEDENRVTIDSPIVGIFHPKNLKVGDKIEVGTNVCIIEAMKLMNEIESDKAGVILEILLDDGEPVEFGQPLFVIG